jgi:hypothetical protein
VDITTLTIDSDFTAFMQEGVPEQLRQAALRRLWVLMQLPVSCDELCDAPEAAAAGIAHAASDKRGAATQ